MAFASPIMGWMSRTFAVLTVLALAVRFAVPAGAMLAQSAEDGDLPTLVVCTSAGMITIKAEGYGVPAKPDQDNGKSGESCVFAAMAAVAAPAGSVLDLPEPMPAATAPWIAIQQRPGDGLAAPPPPSTGPPSLV